MATVECCRSLYECTSLCAPAAEKPLWCLLLLLLLPTKRQELRSGTDAIQKSLMDVFGSVCVLRKGGCAAFATGSIDLRSDADLAFSAPVAQAFNPYAVLQVCACRLNTIWLPQPNP